MELSLKDSELLRDLCQKATTCIEPDTEAGLLDIPHHTNCGDAAILQGELAAFSHRGVKLAYVAHSDTYNSRQLRRAIPPGGTVYLHGGGSFGDLYAETHEFRLRAFRELHDFRLVMLPQTFGFITGPMDDLTRRTIDAHPNCLLYLRDQRSYEIAVDAFQVPCALAPDMAFALGPGERPALAGVPILYLRRTDKEGRITVDVGSGANVAVADWPGTVTHPRNFDSLPGLVLHRVLQQSPSVASPLLSRSLVWLSKRRYERGCRILSRGEIVVTDRLHGHILSTLMGIPNVVFDSGYGKIASYIETWTSSVSYVRTTDDAKEALKIAKMLQRSWPES